MEESRESEIQRSDQAETKLIPDLLEARTPEKTAEQATPREDRNVQRIKNELDSIPYDNDERVRLSPENNPVEPSQQKTFRDRLLDSAQALSVSLLQMGGLQ